MKINHHSSHSGFLNILSTVSLQRKLLLFVVTALSIIFAGTGFLIYKLINDTFLESEKRHIEIIAEPLSTKVGMWYFINKDSADVQMEEFLTNMLDSYDLQYIAFRDATGKLLTEVKTADYSTNDPYALRYHKAVFSPEDGGYETILGTLEIGYSHRILKQLANKYYIAAVLIIILLALYFYLEMRLLRELLTPLRNIAVAIKGYLPGEKLAFNPAYTQRSDVISEIVNGFLHMQRNIDDAMKLQAIEEENNRAKDAILLRQSRFTEMGTMISNIAHQWKQPLNIVELCITDLTIKGMMGPVDPAYQEKIFDDMHRQVEFMSKTIDLFNNFLSDDVRQKTLEVFSLKKAIEDTMQLLSSTIEKKKVAVGFRLDTTAEAYGAISEIEQVLLVLLNNAIDAGSSKLWIECRAEKEYGLIRISDNGGGIAPGIIDKIFDAYFTTKHQSQGTGLGLFIAKTIVEMKFHGTIEAHNLSKGAQFIIRLPLPPEPTDPLGIGSPAAL